MSVQTSVRGRPRSVVPSYRLHRRSGQAVVTVAGRDLYLGPHGSSASRERYGQIIARVAAGHPPEADKRQAPDTGPSVDEVLAAYFDYSQTHYVKHGVVTSEVSLVSMTIKPLHEKYDDVPASMFGPLLLKSFRDGLIARGWCRNTINQTVGRVRRIFKWAVAEEMIGPEVLQRLQAVPALRAGRTTAPDRPKRTAIGPDQIDPVRQRVRPLVRDMIDVQLSCGARSGELLQLTTAMVDRSGPVWVATLTRHKTDSAGGVRKLYFPPSVQAVLAKYLCADQNKPFFKMRRDAYCRAIVRACDELGIERWSPHFLRHTYLTRVRELHGIEAAQVLAGHSAPDMTAVYSQKMDNLAECIASKLA